MSRPGKGQVPDDQRQTEGSKGVLSGGDGWLLPKGTSFLFFGFARDALGIVKCAQRGVWSAQSRVSKWQAHGTA